MGAQSIDNLTQIPEDLFEDLLKAGKKARARGQHQLARSKLGHEKLCLTDKQPKQPRQSQKASAFPQSERARKEISKKECAADANQFSAALFVSNGFTSGLSKKAIGQRVESDFLSKDFISRKPYQHEVKPFISSMYQTSSRSASVGESGRMAGSGYRAASSLKQGRTSSVPIKSNSR